MRGVLPLIMLAVLFTAPAPGAAGDAHAQRPEVRVAASVAGDSVVLARLEAGFRAGNPAVLLADAADPIDLAIYGHGASYSRSQAAVVLLDFFRRHPPDQITFREEVAAEDRRSLVGRYHEASRGEPSAVFIRLRARNGRWEVRSIRIERVGRH